MSLLVATELLLQLSLAAPALIPCHRPAAWYLEPAADEGVIGRNAEGDDYRRWCRPAADGDRICLAGPLGLGSESVITFELSYRRGDTVLHRAELGADVTAGTEALVVDQLSMDGITAPSFVAAVLASRSNGIGIEHWSVWVYDTNGQPRLADIPVANYGELSGWFRQHGESQCDLWVSQWCQGSEPESGSGLYVEGYWLQATDTETLVRRRYRESFAEARRNNSEPRPLNWFTHPSASRAPLPALGSVTGSYLSQCGSAPRPSASAASFQNNQP